MHPREARAHTLLRPRSSSRSLRRTRPQTALSAGPADPNRVQRRGPQNPLRNLTRPLLGTVQSAVEAWKSSDFCGNSIHLQLLSCWKRSKLTVRERGQSSVCPANVGGCGCKSRGRCRRRTSLRCSSARFASSHSSSSSSSNVSQIA